MATQLEKFEDIYKRVAENVGLNSSNTQHQNLAKGWVNRAYLDFNGKFPWPWTFSRFSFNTVVNESIGTVSVTNGSRTVTGSGTSFTSSHEGQVFMLERETEKKYVILKVNSSTELILEQPYNETTGSSLPYLIWTKYYTLASDINNLYNLYVEDRKLFWSHIAEFDDRFGDAPKRGNIRHWAKWGYDHTSRSYSDGTVSLTLNSAIVTGSGTAFIGNVQCGDLLTLSEEKYHVKTVDSDTQLTLIERATVARTGVTYTLTSEQAPTIILDGVHDTNRQVVNYTYKMRTYPMQNDNEIPNVDRQFFDVLVIGGMLYGYEFLDDTRQVTQVQLFDKAIREAWAFFDSGERPEVMEWSVEAGRNQGAEH